MIAEDGRAPTIPIMSISMNAFCAASSLGLCSLGISAYSTQEASSPAVTVSAPQERNYLDPDPMPSRGGGGPNYVRDNLTSSSQQTDAFGTGVLPRIP